MNLGVHVCRVALAAGSDDEEHFQKKDRARLARDKLRLNPVVLGDALFCSRINCDHNDIAGAILSSMLPTKTQLLVWQNQLKLVIHRAAPQHPDCPVPPCRIAVLAQSFLWHIGYDLVRQRLPRRQTWLTLSVNTLAHYDCSSRRQCLRRC